MRLFSKNLLIVNSVSLSSASMGFFLLEDLLQEHLAQRRRQLIDQAADAEVLIVDDKLLGVEHLADLNGDLRLLVGLGKVAQVARHRADTDDDGALAADAQRLLDLHRELLQIVRIRLGVHLLNEHDVALAHGDDNAVLAVGHQVLHRLHRHILRVLVAAADHEDAARHLRVDVQLLRADIDIAQQDVVGDDVLHERCLVVLFLIVALRAVERDGGHGASRARDLVLSLGVGGKVELPAPAGKRPEGLALQHDAGVLRVVDGLDEVRVFLADLLQLRAGDDRALRVDDADAGIRRLLELGDHIQKHSARHCFPPLTSYPAFCATCQLIMLIIREGREYCKRFFLFSTNFLKFFVHSVNTKNVSHALAAIFVGQIAYLSIFSSASDSSRHAPGARPSSSCSGPMARRLRYATGLPRAANMRLI